MRSKLALVSAATFAVGLLAPLTVHAGPPMICHPYQIGAAKSLPGATDGHWLGISKAYDRANLVRDTLELLTPETPILVRMETLRRAAIYATREMAGWAHNGGGYTAEDREIAGTLLKRLRDRGENKDPAQRALALFDAGFFAETLRQTNLDPGFDGYAAMVEAAKARHGDPEIEFALALASTKRPEQPGHLARARAAAPQNALLASNLATHFGKS